MMYYVVSVIHGMVLIFINCVYLKFSNPGTGSLGHIHSRPISYSYPDASGIFLAKFHNPSSLPGNFIDVFLKRKS